MNLENLTNTVCNLCKNVGKYIRDENLKIKAENIELKGRNNFVTYVDKQSEIRLATELGRLLPEAGFLVEENTIKETKKDFMWVIDPLDGTTNYIHQVPFYSISIALMEKDEVILGVIYELNTKECFCSWKGDRAYLNGKPISVSETTKINDAFLATGFPYYDYSKLNQYLEFFKYCMKESRGIRRLGSAAVDLAYVACGRFDCFFEYGLNPWDVAAGSFLVKQAGGQVKDFSNCDDYIFGKEIISSNAKLHDELMNIIFKYFA